MQFNSPGEEFKYLYERMACLCEEQGWGDPFSYARGKEIYASIELGHKVAGTLPGADAFNKEEEPVEYKSTTGKAVKGAYTGISVQPTWEEQEVYLREKKIEIYPEHFFNRFEVGRLAESWVMSGAKVLEVLHPKLYKKYPTVLNKKDPRLSATVTTKEIKKYGRRVI
jgi:hypothetical protein